MSAVPPPDSRPDDEPVSRAAERSKRYFTGFAALRNRVFGTDQFFRLWLAQVVT